MDYATKEDVLRATGDIVFAILLVGAAEIAAVGFAIYMLLP